MNLAAIPSPDTGVWHIGPVPIRAYSIAIVIGIFLAVWITERRLRRQGAPPGVVIDIAVWAVPFGIIGARLYHVITDAQLYFGPGREPIEALKIWNPGLGIPGALLAGALGAWIGCRRHNIPLSMLADALAPGLPIAQAVGRLGNWFNQELYGRPTELPWALSIDVQHREQGYEQFETFHPTFLYEALWNLGGAALIFWLDRRFKFGKGRAFALYVIMYAVGRFWVESLRIDSANSFLGFRLNMWTAIIALIGGVTYFLLVSGPRQRLAYDDAGNMRVVVDTAAAPAAGQPSDDADQTAADQTADGGTAADETADAATDADPPEQGEDDENSATDSSEAEQSAADAEREAPEAANSGTTGPPGPGSSSNDR
ncbi:MAG: prolipoprotein diacylglyceryl transferase [Micromonosporaceae bacterium]